MKDIIGKLVALFCIIIVITFFVNHGKIDFSGVDYVKDKTVEAVNSEEGQQYIQETKDITKQTFHDLFYGAKELITGKGDPDEASEEETLTEATLLSCENANTLKAAIDEKEETIKLIGIDIPEEIETDGITSDQYVAALLKNVSTIYLEYDVNTKDSDGNILAYVWISNKPTEPEVNMLNAMIVKNGYAQDASNMPNTKYADTFLKLKLEAQENEEGLWQYPEYRKMWES